jgi:hypothetical protein
MENMKKETCKLALVNLFKSDNFNICTIDALLKLTNTIPDPESYKIMHALHCIKYSEMSQEFREKLLRTTINIFKNNGFNFEEIEKIFSSNIIDVSEEPEPKHKLFSFLR